MKPRYAKPCRGCGLYYPGECFADGCKDAGCGCDGCMVHNCDWLYMVDDDDL